MEESPLSLPLPSSNSKRRSFSENNSSSSASSIGPDVALIDAQDLHSPKLIKQNQGFSAEDSDEVTVIDEKEDSTHKWKAINDVCDGLGYHQAKANNSSDTDGHISHCSYDDDDYYDDFVDVDDYSTLQTHFDNLDIPPGAEAHISWLTKYEKINYTGSSTSHTGAGGPPQVDNEIVALSSSLNYASVDKDPGMMLPIGVESLQWTSSINQTTSTDFLDMSDDEYMLFEEEVDIPWFQEYVGKQNTVGVDESPTTPSVSISDSKQKAPADDNLEVQLFERFDTVEDYSDHHYAQNKNLVKQPSNNWVKRIQDEWKMLGKGLPDTIFVRVYESRMDLLRAVLVGAHGTPYHDGLFFFDVLFPSDYPNVPPKVHYHSGGLRLNPNLYTNGKVCLSLLNTWSGDKNQKWIPGVSTMLQVLVSIQGLILNQKPYFNEPGYESTRGSVTGERQSQKYNENTFILSLRTMVYSMRRPPKHFEDLVAEHFGNRAKDILVACKAHMTGVKVGCYAKGEAHNAVKGATSCSQEFRDSLAGCIDMLMNEFIKNGASSSQKFISQTKNKAKDTRRDVSKMKTLKVHNLD